MYPSRGYMARERELMNDTRYYSVKLTRSAKKDFEKIPEEFKIALCNELISLAGERNPKRWMHRIIGQLLQ